MIITILCKEMAWTFDEYQNQPSWFIQDLISYLVAEANHRNKK